MKYMSSAYLSPFIRRAAKSMALIQWKESHNRKQGIENDKR